MSFSNALKRAFLPVAIAATGLIAAPAQALETDKDGCMSIAEFNTQLKAEGQGSVIFGESLTPANGNTPEKSSFVIFTALKSGKVGKGYSFIADTPLGVTPTKMCKSGEFNNARGLEVKDASIPTGISESSNLAKVINFSIKEKGFSPMYYGEKNGATIVVVGNPDIKGSFNGMILIGNNDPSRKADDLGGLRKLAYSPNYDRPLAALSGSIKMAGLASASPKP